MGLIESIAFGAVMLVGVLILVWAALTVGDRDE